MREAPNNRLVFPSGDDRPFIIVIASAAACNTLEGLDPWREYEADTLFQNLLVLDLLLRRLRCLESSVVTWTYALWMGSGQGQYKRKIQC